MAAAPPAPDPASHFQAPDGRWYLLWRAVSYDSWLVWRDALPDSHQQRQRLDQRCYDTIVQLGRAIHEIHLRLPEYRRLGDSPFRVGRWWDPDGEPPWCEGRRVLLRHRHLSAAEFLHYRPPRSELQGQVISHHWLELELPLKPAPAADGPAMPPPAPQSDHCPAP